MTTRREPERRQTAVPRTRQEREARRIVAGMQQQAQVNERLRQAFDELEGQSPVEFLQQGGDPDVLRTLGVEDADVDALVSAAPHISGDGRLDVLEARRGGVSSEALQRLGITTPGLDAPPLPRSTAELQQGQTYSIPGVGTVEVEDVREVSGPGEFFDRDDRAMRARGGPRQQVRAGTLRVQGVGDVRFTELDDGSLQLGFGTASMGTTPMDFATAISRVIGTERQTQQEIAQGALITDRPIEPVLQDGRVVGFRERDLFGTTGDQVAGTRAPVASPEVQDTLERLEPYRDGNDYNLSAAFLDGAVSEVEAARAGFQPNDIARSIRAAADVVVTGQAQQVQRETGRFPTPEEDLDVGPGQPPRTFLDLRPVEDGFDLSPRMPAGRFAPEQVAAFQGLISQGYADVVGGPVFVAEADDAGLRPLLIQAGFTEQQIDRAEQDQRRAFDEAEFDAFLLQQSAEQAEESRIERLRGEVMFDPRTGESGRPVFDEQGRIVGVEPIAEGVNIPIGDILERAVEPVAETFAAGEERFAQETFARAGIMERDPELERTMERLRAGEITPAEAQDAFRERFSRRPIAQQLALDVVANPLVVGQVAALAPEAGRGIFRLAVRASERGVTRELARPTLTQATNNARITAQSYAEAAQQGARPSLTVEASSAGDDAFLGQVRELKDILIQSRRRGQSIVPMEDLPGVDLPEGAGEFLLRQQPLREVQAVQINMRPYPEWIRGGLEAERIIAAQTPDSPGVFTDLVLTVKEPIARARLDSITQELRGIPNITVKTLAQEGDTVTIRDADFLARRLRDVGTRVTRTDEVIVPPGEGWGEAVGTNFNIELRPRRTIGVAEQPALNPGEVVVAPDPFTSTPRVVTASLPTPVDFTRQVTMFPRLQPGDPGLLAQRVAPTLRQALTMRLGASRADELLARTGIEGNRPAELVFSEVPEFERVELGQEIIDTAENLPGGLTPQERTELRRLVVRSSAGPEIAQRRVTTAAPEVRPELQELVERSRPTPEPPARAAASTPQLQRQEAPAARPRVEVADRPTTAAPELQELVGRGVAAPLTASQVGIRLAQLTQMARERPLTAREQESLGNIVQDLSGVALTPAQQRRFDDELNRLRGFAPAAALAPQLTPQPQFQPAPTPQPSELTAPQPFPAPQPEPLPQPQPFPTPETTTQPEPTTTTQPTLQTPPARPPRTPTTGGPPGRPPRRPPGLPDLDALGRDAEGRLNIEVIGVQRGAVGDTRVNLVTGERETVKDIEAVPDRPTNQSITALEFGDRPTMPVRDRWGANDRWVFPDGTHVFIKAGRPMEEAIRKKQMKDRGEFQPRQRQRQPRQRNPFRSRGMRGRRI